MVASGVPWHWHSIGNRPRRRSTFAFRPGVEVLEERSLLSVGGPDFPDTFADAQPLALAPDHTATVTGRIDVNDVDVFRVEAPANSILRVRQSAASGSTLDSVLAVYDADGNLLDEEDDTFQGINLNAEVVLPALAGRTYFLVPHGFKFASTGVYDLRVAFEPYPPDDHGNTFGAATLVPVAADAPGMIQGAVNFPGDSDFFRFEAPAAGGLHVDYSVVAFGVNGVVALYDEGRNLLATLTRTQPQFEVTVRPGQAFFLQVTGAGGSSAGLPVGLSPDTGAYAASVTFLEDDVGSLSSEAQELAVGLSGPTTTLGRIDFTGDEDWFRIQAPADGILRIRYSAQAGTSTDVILHVLDESLNPIAYQDGFGSGTRGRTEVALSVRAGEIFYIRASAFAESSGPFDLTVELVQLLAARPAPSRPVPLLIAVVLENDSSVLVSPPADRRPETPPEDTGTQRSPRVTPPPVIRPIPDSSGKQADVSLTHTAESVSTTGGDALADQPGETVDGELLALAKEQGLSGQNDLPSGTELIQTLLTGGAAVTRLLPQRGMGLVPVAAVVGGEGGPDRPAAAQAEPVWFDFVIGLDDTIHRTVPAAAVKGVDAVRLLPEETPLLAPVTEREEPAGMPATLGLLAAALAVAARVSAGNKPSPRRSPGQAGGGGGGASRRLRKITRLSPSA